MGRRRRRGPSSGINRRLYRKKSIYRLIFPNSSPRHSTRPNKPQRGSGRIEDACGESPAASLDREFALLFRIIRPLSFINQTDASKSDVTAAWDEFWVSWAVLGAFWGVLGVFSKALGRSWGGLGGSWGALGGVLGRSWAVLGRSWGDMKSNLISRSMLISIQDGLRGRPGGS